MASMAHLLTRRLTRPLSKRLDTTFGGTEWTPLLLSPAVWYDVAPAYCYVERAAPTTPSSVNGVVGTILDRSGNARHWVAPSDAARPILKQAGALYYLQFDGIDDRMSVTVALPLPVYRVAAVRQVSWTSGDRLFWGGVASASFLFNFTSTPNIAHFSGALGPLNGNLAVGTAGVVTEVWSAANNTLQVNNTAAVTQTVANVAHTSLETSDVGNMGNNDYFGVVALSGAVSAPNLALLKTYLGAKCGITI